ncbi:hypothetical protein FRB95_005362 [Tulasnella sp. JGI-2019a]|nr:hypothetical protein FRB95_005362 [Tulasnella sp. JGI-2019a]
MATPRGKRARTDTGTAGGLALPTTQPSTGASTPAKTPGQALPAWSAAQPMIDPALQNQTAASTATKAVAQAATGYLNSGAASQAYYPHQYYNAYYAQQYPAAAGQPGTPGVYTYQQSIQYAQAYQQQQQYAQQQAQMTAAQQQPYVPTATSAAVTAASQRLMPPTTNTTMALPKQATTPAQPAAQSLDTSSVAQLTDALGSAGVDIRAEEEALARMAPGQQASAASALSRQDDRSTKQNFLDPVILAAKVKEITSNHALTATPNAQTYIALALQSRLSTLITQTISAVDHRLESQFNRPPPLYPIDPNTENGEPLPMWSALVRRDVSKQLQALEKIDREEETRARRRRKEREQNENNNAMNNNNPDGTGNSGGAADDTMEDTEGRKKKKRKVDGPGIMAKNMSDEVQKKMANMTAHAQLGGIAKKYSWMQPGGGGGSATPTKPAAPNPTATPTPKPITATSTITSTGGTTGGFVRPFVTNKVGGIGTAPAEGEDPDERKLTLADVMFVVGRERGHGAGKGSAKVWSISGF